MRARPFPVLLLAIFVVAGCSVGVGGPHVVASGKLAHETRNVGAFQRIEVGGQATLDVRVGQPQSLALDADDNVLPLVNTEVRGDTLVIRLKGSFRDKSGHGIHVTISTPTLSALQVGGACTAQIAGVSGPTFDVEIRGAANVTADGSTEHATVGVSGSGDINLEKLTAKTADVDVAGAGNVTLHVTEALNAKVSGVGNVRYSGNPPKVEQKVHGIGRIEPI